MNSNQLIRFTQSEIDQLEKQWLKDQNKEGVSISFNKWIIRNIFKGVLGGKK